MCIVTLHDVSFLSNYILHLRMFHCFSLCMCGRIGKQEQNMKHVSMILSRLLLFVSGSMAAV